MGGFCAPQMIPATRFKKISPLARADREGLRHVKIKRDGPRFFSLSTVILKNRVLLVMGRDNW